MTTMSLTSAPALRREVTAKFFRALGDPTRLHLLSLLLSGEKSVMELVAAVGSSQGRVSNHLACLKQCGLATCRREGKFIYYSLASEEVTRLLELSQALIARNAEAIWACTRVNDS